MVRSKRGIGSVIQKPNGRWYGSISVPDPDGGPSRRKALGGFPNKSGAEAALAQAIVDLREGKHSSPQSLTLGRYLTDIWLPSIAGDVRPTTFANARALIGAYGVGLRVLALLPLVRSTHLGESQRHRRSGPRPARSRPGGWGSGWAGVGSNVPRKPFTEGTPRQRRWQQESQRWSRFTRKAREAGQPSCCGLRNKRNNWTNVPGG